MDRLRTAADNRPTYVIHLDPAGDLHAAGMLLLDDRDAVTDEDFARVERENDRRVNELDAALRRRLTALAERDDVTIDVVDNSQAHLHTETGGSDKQSAEGQLWQEAHDTVTLSWLAKA